LVPTVRFEGSENCLFLNVYRPTDAAEGTDLPVLFYIHGGGDIIGAADKTFPGDYLAAEHRMVVVVVQYRWVATAVATEAPRCSEPVQPAPHTENPGGAATPIPCLGSTSLGFSRLGP
jgi:hypothetical protein